MIYPRAKPSAGAPAASKRAVVLRNASCSLKDGGIQEAGDAGAVHKAKVEEESFFAVASLAGRIAEADFRRRSEEGGARSEREEGTGEDNNEMTQKP